MLLLWLFSAKAFGAYTPSIEDAVIIQSIEPKIDSLSISNPSKLSTIQQKLSVIIPTLSPDTQAHYVLNELFLIIKNLETQPTSELNNPSDALIQALASQFK